ncbi:MAG: nicotinate (nicotinamide) nucleotide adenylyltransferase [Candidatus Neomarinimicrobiota bacterium]|jgi:nicotinate-nucleotide adenylyltransferase
MKKICLYGGSFDPVHLGHINFAKHILQRFKAESLFFIPTYFSPFKGETRYSSNIHRVNMLELACRDIPKAGVLTLEIERQGFSYTIDTLKALHEQFPDHKLYWIIGDDHLNTLYHWRAYPEHFKYCDFIILPRTGAVSKDMTLNHTFKEQLHFIEAPEINISSTQIRQALIDEKDIDSLVPLDIKNYILENKLYR